MGYDLLNDQDRKQLKAAGISPKQAKAQLDFFKIGAKPLMLRRPCTAGDGIVTITEAALATLAGRHDETADAGRCMKFVPASGAASRMFSDWHNTLQQGALPHRDMERLAEDLPRFAFFQDLKEGMSSRGQDVFALMEKGDLHHILNYILSPGGMNYGHLPKALLKFHNTEEGGRTAIEEHLVEAAFYTADKQKTCRIHFTVSEEHRKQTASFLARIKETQEARLGVTFEIGLSSQSGSSRTLAMEGEGLYRDRSGRLILRPGGHGALLENLSALDGDIVFIKNIDNVVPDSLKSGLVFYKKVLGGYFIGLEEEIFRHLRDLSTEETVPAAIVAAKLFCQQKLQIAFSAEFAGFPLAQQHRVLLDRLNRPLRVCGMVKNEGEPGGGPFWVDEGKELSRQIVEYHQIESGSAEQRAIWSAATHFNPVDLVCGLRDYQGRRFNLKLFVDPTAVSLTEKIERGRRIKVLEYPGLWNGSMARWNTVFVEVPNSTFNPVKTIADLLRPQHQV